MTAMRQRDQFGDIVRALEGTEASAALARVSTPWWGRIPYALINLLDDFLARVWHREELWDQGVAEEFASRFATSLLNQQVHVRYLAPLEGFDFPDYVSPIQLIPGCRLLVLDDTDWIEFERKELIANRGIKARIDLPYFFLELRRQEPIPGSQTKSIGPDLELINRCAIAISLATGWGCHVLRTTRLVEPGEVSDFGHSGRTQPVTDEHLLWLKSTLMTPEIPTLVTYLQQMGLIEEMFPAVYSRLSNITRRDDALDALIDACVALESLLLAGEQQEVSFKFALRGAWIVAPTKVDRMAAYKRFHDLYDKRSKIVHGSDKAGAIAPGLVAEALTLLTRVMASLLTSKLDRTGWNDYVKDLAFGT